MTAKSTATGSSLTERNWGDLLVGDSGDNSLTGGADHDELRGPEGNDVLIGGTGGDYFIFGTFRDEVGADLITDFRAAEGDKVWLWDDLGITTMSQVLATTRDTAQGLMLDFGKGNSLTLAGVTKAQLKVQLFAGMAETEGTPGDDTLTGGSGADVFDGGPFFYSPGNGALGNKTITDFRPFEGDRIDLTDAWASVLSHMVDSRTASSSISARTRVGSNGRSRCTVERSPDCRPASWT